MDDPYDLQRFVRAQKPIFAQALAELKNGRKASHWMWFVFPQIRGLGGSPMAVRFAIGSLDEAKAYLAHQILGERLRACTDAVNLVDGRSALDIFGRPDDLKFRSSMTLFSRAAPEETRFSVALAKYYGGDADRATIAALVR